MKSREESILVSLGSACEGSEQEKSLNIPVLGAAQLAWSLWTRVREVWVRMER